MTREMWMAVIRHTITTLGGALVAAGDLQPGELETLGGGAAILFGIAWSFIAKRRGNA